MSAAPVEHRFAGPAGALCWFEWGRAGEGPTLLLLHATGFHARCWDRVVAALPAGLHIVALELRGHGRSYRPETLSDWAATTDDVVAFVDQAIAGPVFAIGHSMGGYVAARTAALRPGRFVRLLLVDPVIVPPEIYQTFAGQSAGDPGEHPVSRRRNAWESPEQMIAHFAGRPPYAHWEPPVLADYCRFGLLPAGNGYALACPPRLEASAYMGATRTDPYPLLPEVACPVTVLRARNAERASSLDFSISPTWPGVAGCFRDGRDQHWPEISHFIPMEVPERLAALIARELDR